MTRIRRRPSPALLVALLALFVALGGPAYAQKLLVGNKHLKKGAVDTRVLRRAAVTSPKVQDRSLRVEDLTRGAVAALEATPTGSVGVLQLLDGAVTAPKLAAGAVTTAALGPAVVTGPNIALGTIGVDNLGESSVGGGKIRNGAVHKEDIAQQAVGQQELAGTRGTGVVAAGTIGGDECSAAIDVAVTPPPAATDATGVLDDVVVGARGAGWPAALDLRVQASAPGTLTASACNTGTAEVTVPAGGLPFAALTIAA